MLRVFLWSISDLADRRILAILLQALLITLAIFLLLGALMAWLLAGADPCGWLGMEACPVDTAAGGIGAAFITLLGAWLLFPGLAIGVVMGFTDRVTRIVEQRHYHGCVLTAHPIGAARGAFIGIRSALRVLLFNLLALPFYLLLLFTGIGPFVLFVIVNGLAFGRDLAELAAARYGDRESRRAWLKRTRGEQGMMGTLVGVMFLVPILNLIAPIVGLAMAIHLFNRDFKYSLASGVRSCE